MLALALVFCTALPIQAQASDRRYQNPKGYCQVVEGNIKVKSHGKYKKGATLKKGFGGLRVALVKKKLGMGYRDHYKPTAAYYTDTVKSRVRAWQKKHGLKATGNVDLATWKKMGYTEHAWYTLDSYASPNKTNRKSSRKDHIETMIHRAREYKGNPYIWGSSCSPKYGTDCSGLVMQALYASGLDLGCVDPIWHTYPGKNYGSRKIWESAKIKHVAYKNRKRGDLIFFKPSRNGKVDHVAIYLGGNKIIDSWPGVGISEIKIYGKNAYNSGRMYIEGVARPFQ